MLKAKDLQMIDPEPQDARLVRNIKLHLELNRIACNRRDERRAAIISESALALSNAEDGLPRRPV